MYAKLVKPGLDRVAAAVLLVILFVPLLIVAVWIKLDSRGPVIFRQLRYGKDKQPFVAYKFRTMATDAPADMPTSDFTDAGSYITKAGKIMRKLSIDELPQLFNALRGEMSIVGPRPVVLTEIRLMEMRDQVGANAVKPGITGWAQVNGRDELNDAVKSRMDGEYVKNLGPKMDAKCIALTIFAVLSIKGHREGHEVEETGIDPGMMVDKG